MRFCTDQHAEHAPGAHDRHAGQRMVDLLTRFRAIGELRMALRVVERERPGVGGDVADQALADPQARAMHGRGIEALGGEQLEHFAGAQQVDRAHLGHHLVGDQAHDLAQGFLGRGATRHRVPEPLEEHSRSGQGSPSLHGQTARCLSWITTKLRSMMQAQTRHAADRRALVAAICGAGAVHGRLIARCAPNCLPANSVRMREPACREPYAMRRLSCADAARA